MSDFLGIEELTDREILDLYDDILDDNAIISGNWRCINGYCVCNNGISASGASFYASNTNNTTRASGGYYNPDGTSTQAHCVGRNGIVEAYGYHPCYRADGRGGTYYAEWGYCFLPE